jgi:citrate synthase
VVVVETRLSGVDGEAEELTIAGFPLEELAGRASFEEVDLPAMERRVP